MWNFRLLPDQASTGAREVDWLCIGLLIVCGFYFLVVFLPLTYFSIKYRRGSKASRANAINGSNFIEITWTLIPTFMSVGLFAWGAVVYFNLERPPADALQVEVVGKQWMWKLQHAEGKREINELHVPLGRAVRLTMTSQDVIHSFYVPAFRTKQDVVPGKYVTEWFKPTRLGTYHLFCAEYCGTHHSGMIGRVIVMEPNEYQKWLTTGDAGDPVVATGRRLFTQLGCSGCHEGNGTVRAPRLEGIFGKPVPLSDHTTIVADERYIRDSILMPQAQIAAGYENLMPTFTGRINEEELFQIIEYLRSLSNTVPPLPPVQQPEAKAQPPMPSSLPQQSAPQP
jgi:cytochrome c oxidase subunit 2